MLKGMSYWDLGIRDVTLFAELVFLYILRDHITIMSWVRQFKKTGHLGP